MIFARNPLGRSIRAAPTLSATCPDCAGQLVPKCGEIVTWHWAHRAQPGANCHYRPETAWHLRWKEWALNHGCRVEVVLVPGHRADIVTPSGLVVELQSEGLDGQEVREREEAYKRMLWIYRVSPEQKERLHWGKEVAGGLGFWYKRGPKLLAIPTRRVYLDLHEGEEDELLRVRLTLKEKQHPQYGPYQRLLGIAWSEDAYAVFELDKQTARVRALLAHLYANRDKEWYQWVVDHRLERIGQDQI